MRVPVFAGMVVVVSTAAQACTLSEGDIKALAASPSHLTPSEFSALAPAQQESVCNTRAFIKKIDAQKGNMTKMEKYSTKYLSPTENDRMVAASDKFLEKIMKSKGL